MTGDIDIMIGLLIQKLHLKMQYKRQLETVNFLMNLSPEKTRDDRTPTSDWLRSRREAELTILENLESEIRSVGSMEEDIRHDR